MSYNATVFNVMIASPSDVPEERSIIRDILYDWNAVNSSVRKIVLLPVGWETHSFPEMGGSPQEIINNQILFKCDLLVAVFGVRIGTSTGRFPSGTVEEAERHMNSGKPTMVYFSQEDVPRNIDRQQLEKVEEYKERLQNRGLIETYINLQEFKEKFSRHLQIKLNDPIFLKLSENVSTADPITKQYVPTLSNDAFDLLKEARSDSHGVINCIRGVRGMHQIHTGNSVFGNDDPQEFAKWRQALKELEDNKLVEDRSGNGQAFYLTHSGFNTGD